MFLQALKHDNYFAGTYNAVAPNPATNAEFMHTLRLRFIVHGVHRSRPGR